MITKTYFGKRENLDMSDRQALLCSLEYMFGKTEAKHGGILTSLNKEEIKRALGCFIAEKVDNEFYISVIGDNNRIANIFPVEYFGNIGVPAQRVFKGFRFDYLSILGIRSSLIHDNVVKECLRRFEYLL